MRLRLWEIALLTIAQLQKNPVYYEDPHEIDPELPFTERNPSRVSLSNRTLEQFKDGVRTLVTESFANRPTR